jgi:signal transduction histidine kinase
MGLVQGAMPKLSDLFAAENQGKIVSYKAQSQWQSAIAALEQLLLSRGARGLVIAGPVPTLSHPKILQNFTAILFHAGASNLLKTARYQLPTGNVPSPSTQVLEFPLTAQDPLIYEQFCLVFTADFAALLVLSAEEEGLSSFNFSFAPEIILQATHLLMERGNHHTHLNNLLAQFPAVNPSPQLLTDFSRQLLNHLSTYELPPSQTPPPTYADIEILQALTHEIRTPLTTIRTMTRLLLKRANLAPEVVRCLEIIDLECTEQINRMELIFKATEMGIEETALQLVPTSIEQVFAQSIPQWKKQAKRRNVNLEFILPQNLPQVTSDPQMLDQMLTGLLEKCTRNVPPGGQIQVQVTTAGHQLKVQVYSQAPCSSNPFKALGQLLMFQPATGSISLNLDVTKNLFHALGGKLIVRQRPQEGEVMTVFLPLDIQS